MIKEFRVSFANENKCPQSDHRLIAKYYRAWNIHQAVDMAKRDFPGEKLSIVEINEQKP